MIDMGSFPPERKFMEPVWHCLRCDAAVLQSMFDFNGGVCNDCPPLGGSPQAIALELKLKGINE